MRAGGARARDPDPGPSELGARPRCRARSRRRRDGHGTRPVFGSTTRSSPPASRPASRARRTSGQLDDELAVADVQPPRPTADDVQLERPCFGDRPDAPLHVVAPHPLDCRAAGELPVIRLSACSGGIRVAGQNAWSGGPLACCGSIHGRRLFCSLRPRASILGSTRRGSISDCCTSCPDRGTTRSLQPPCRRACLRAGRRTGVVEPWHLRHGPAPLG